MKTTISSALLSGAILTLGTLQTQAQDSMPAPMQFAPAELMACSYNEGKGAEDGKALTDAFTAWVEENDPDYSYWMIWPQFHEDPSQWDVGLLGAWSNGAGFGAGYDAWVESRGDVGEMFEEVFDCNNTMAAVTPIMVPEDTWGWDEGTLWFQRCTQSEGARLSDAVMAHRQGAMAMAEMAEPSASWAFVPVLGAGDLEFDYYHVESWPSYEALGSSFDAYFNKGGYAPVSAALSDRVSCATPNLYHWVLIHGASD